MRVTPEGAINCEASNDTLLDHRGTYQRHQCCPSGYWNDAPLSPSDRPDAVSPHGPHHDRVRARAHDLSRWWYYPSVRRVQ